MNSRMLYYISPAPLISISMCSNPSCTTNCIQWVSKVGICEACSEGTCSESNPSLIRSFTSFALYSDSACSYPINSSLDIPFTVDSRCYGITKPYIIKPYVKATVLDVLSYDDSIIPLAVFLSFTLAIYICCCFCLCNRKWVLRHHLNVLG
jgi:hypothetical protein